MWPHSRAASVSAEFTVGEHKAFAGPASGRAAARQDDEDPVDGAVLGEGTLHLVLVLEFLWRGQMCDVIARRGAA